MKLSYLLLDVFTTTPLSGNPLAVVEKGDGLLDNQMQAIAKEFGLSETVFLTRPSQDRHTAGVRIFTPAIELPFAGHPTVGAAAVLGLQHRLSAVRIEERVGLITCVVDKLDSRTAHARFALPQLPEVAGKPPERGALALALGLDSEEIGCGSYQPAVYSAGVLFYLIPVRNTQALRRIKLNPGGWDELFPLGNSAIYCFTTVDDEPDTDLAARMFAPGMGLGEDPGTGSAAAALIGLLARHAEFDEGQAEFRLRQGFEMGRPCRIALQLRKSGNALTHASIGGHAVIVGQGALDLD